MHTIKISYNLSNFVRQV